MNAKKIVVNMLSSSEKVKGQGVSGAYRELMCLLREKAQDQLIIKEKIFEKADVTHYHTIDPLFYLTTFFKKKTGRRVGYVHFLPNTLQGSLKIPPFLRGLVSWYVTSFYNRMDQLVVVNPSFIDDLVDHGIKREKIMYIPNFVNNDKWSPVSEEEKMAVRKQYGIAPDAFVVLGAGQVQKRKGVDDFAALAKKMPDVTFVWAGGFSFGAMTDGHERYKRLMENPPANLIFPGIVEAEEMRAFYSMTDIFLLPSYNELFPMTILEAASCGAAIVLRDLSLYQVILEGKYLPAKDVHEMEMVLADLAAHPEKVVDLRQKAGQISQEYSPEALLTIWLDFYKKQAALAR
ncbi:glycosyltransferase [Streptococcus sp. X16XC17]|uniref:glycosyltransferase family 4 protein n=1 Tax=unclassified Streptococcus TaxID=2608887 RepID=UPI00066FCEB6|nr:MULTISPECIES: glycosyltransferase family 4 protein [unclassified Streptococcus]TCD46099.1 glycosyltransferase [Streptococcus sp. X16XC17]